MSRRAGWQNGHEARGKQKAGGEGGGAGKSRRQDTVSSFGHPRAELSELGPGSARLRGGVHGRSSVGASVEPDEACGAPY